MVGFKHMPRPRKSERNKEIVNKIEKKKWSLRKVADHFGLHFTTVKEIYDREKKK